MSEVSNTLMQFNENMAEVIEWAEGQRTNLQARGWTAQSADRFACELLVGITRTMFASAAETATQNPPTARNPPGSD